MRRFLLLVFFFASVFFLPWWFVLTFAVLLLAYERDYLFVLLGGIVADVLHGAPIVLLFDTQYLYTFVFFALILLSMFLRNTLLD